MKERPLLFLPIETKVREYHGKLLLSLAAVEQGFDVILGGQRDLVENVHNFDRGLYLDKSVASTKKKWSKWCEKLGLVTVVHDEEGLVYFDDEIYHELRICKEVLDRVALFFTWGKAQQDTILKGLPEYGPLLAPVGNPRFDMMRPEIRHFYDLVSTQLTELYGKIILINTNFGFYNHHNGVEAERKRLKHYPIARNRPEFFDGWIDAQEKMFHHFEKMLPLLRQAFPDHTIVLRPHPSENKETWQKITDSLPNCYVNSDGNVLEWIYASEVLIHFNCTTAIEAYLLNVPAIAYRPESLDLYEQQLPNALSLDVKNIDELLAFVHQVMKKEKTNYLFGENSERTEVAHYFLSGLEGELSSDKIVGELLARSLVPSRKRNINQNCAVIWRRLWLFAKKIKEGHKRKDEYNFQKFPGIIFDEILRDIAQMQKVTDRFSDVNVSALKNNCFLISSN